MGAFTASGFIIYYVVVIKLQQKIKLPLLLLIGSLILIIGITLLSNPLYSISYVAIFFLALFVFIASLTVILFNLQAGEYGGNLKRILLVDAAIVLLIMLRSAKALNLVDLGLMIFFFGGLSFYLSRR